MGDFGTNSFWLHRQKSVQNSPCASSATNQARKHHDDHKKDDKFPEKWLLDIFRICSQLNSLSDLVGLHTK